MFVILSLISGISSNHWLTIVLLAFAGIFPIFGPKPIYKAIFDKGHLITNSVSVRELDVEQVGDVLLFRFHHDQTYSPTKFDYMAIRLDENGWSNHTFVIESKPKPKYDKVPESSARFCAWDHSGWERKLIKDCHGSMSIRFELNEEEQAKVEESRKGEIVNHNLGVQLQNVATRHQTDNTSRLSSPLSKGLSRWLSKGLIFHFSPIWHGSFRTKPERQGVEI